MIEIREVTKRYGDRLALDDLTFTVRPGVVTGFLGPNGAGKTTTMRLVLGLAAPTRGAATVNGRRYADLPAPLHEVGALLDARAVHGARRGYDHLRCFARSNGIGPRRVAEVLDLVGLAGAARRRVRTYSLGMAQRLGVAAALLGDPAVLMFDEPVNGLDPEGVIWIRTLLRRLAAEGRTVLVSSHLMAEMALTADRLVVIGRGRLIADAATGALVGAAQAPAVLVRAEQEAELARLLSAAGAMVEPAGPADAVGPVGPADPVSPVGPVGLAGSAGSVDLVERGGLLVSGLDGAGIGRLAAAHGVVLTELTPRRASLEEAYLGLTRDAVEYQANEGAPR